jgi:hypothetical protein
MMKHVLIAISFALFVIACGDSDSAGPKPVPANPCATRGATYLVNFLENVGGTCGQLSEQIMYITQDGQVGGTNDSTFACDQTTVDNCTIQNTGCAVTMNDVTCHLNSNVTFTLDGSAAAGYESLWCSSYASSCASTYRVLAARE